MTHLGATSVQDYAKKKFEEMHMTTPKEPALNAQQEAGARKEMGGFFHPIYAVVAKYDPLVPAEKRNNDTVFIEAERWFDARAHGIRHFGVSEVHIKLHELTARPLPRIQLRWVGFASSGHNNNRVQIRTLTTENQNPEHGWHDR